LLPVVAEPARASPTAVGFGDRVSALVAERESQIVLGIDPDPMALWPEVQEVLTSRDLEQDMPEPPPALKAFGFDHDPAAESTAFATLIQCRFLMEAAAPACVGVKFQLACFERLGQWGWRILSTLAGYAHTLGLLTIADGKRGDIDVSARAYADALFGKAHTPVGLTAGLRADACTLNPLMGTDTLTPFIDVARPAGAGVFLLVRTSNPGAADIEDLELADGGRVWERIAEMAHRLGARNVGESGLCDVGAVLGATSPQHLARARELMPHAVFLLPGVGAQGGRVEDLAPAFVPGRAGGLITASRSIANAYLLDGHDGDPAAAARAEAERLRELAWRLT
jgi:orotidine-5'-phosphate decarboxylase